MVHGQNKGDYKMKKCVKCGTEMENEAVFCPECGAKNNELQTEDSKVTFADIAKEAGSSIGTMAGNAGKVFSEKTGEAFKSYENALAQSDKNTVVLADGEILIRSYNVTRVFFPKVGGYLMVTNKRVIFRAASIDSKVVFSMPINSVGTINTFMGRAINWILLLVSIALVVAGVYCLSAGHIAFVLAGLAIFALGAFLFYLATRKGVFLWIASTMAATGMIIGKGNTIGSSFYSIDGVAGTDASKMADELGAIVLDLQQMGDLAIEKWKNKN